MEIAYNENHLKSFCKKCHGMYPKNNTILIDQYLENAIEIDVDLIRDLKVIFTLRELWNI